MKSLTLYVLILAIVSFDTVGQTKQDSLYVFVGEKISVDRFDQKLGSNEIPFDLAFKSKYRVIQNIFGNYSKDTIEFEAYDHYGIPAFSKYRYVVLYVSNHNGKLYHEKYQYADVYKAKNGRWASSYKTGDYKYYQKAVIKPEPIDFSEEVSYKINNRTKEEIAEWFPSPYYEIQGDKAIAIWGNYAEELFELKKGSVLKARGYFN